MPSKKKVRDSDIWFEYVWPKTKYFSVHEGKRFKAQILVLFVEAEVAKVRLFYEDGTPLYRDPLQVPAAQFFEQMKVVSK